MNMFNRDFQFRFGVSLHNDSFHFFDSFLWGYWARISSVVLFVLLPAYIVYDGCIYGNRSNVSSVDPWRNGIIYIINRIVDASTYSCEQGWHVVSTSYRAIARDYDFIAESYKRFIGPYKGIIRRVSSRWLNTRENTWTTSKLKVPKYQIRSHPLPLCA